MNPGLYLTFFKEGEPRSTELPPVGPFEHVVLREGALVADRKSVDHIEESDHANGSRWIEAELELQRSMGTEPGGPRRPHIRVAAKEGVYLRFASFGESAENNPARELGPYAVVTVGPRGVEGDGELLAVPTGSKRALWDLTSTAGVDLAGVVRPDIAFRSEWTAYHPGVRSARAQPTKSEAPASALRHPIIPPAPSTLGRGRGHVVAPARPQPDPPARREQPVPTPSTESGGRRISQPVAVKATAPASVQYSDPASSTLLTRVSANTRSGPTTDGAGGRSRRSLQWGDALWTLRLVIIAVLVLFVGAFGYISIRNTVNIPSVNTVGVGRTIN
ncbi:MAG TPA: hypothetical protein VN971_01375, partial [Thermoanaerobaculia bacterium]|nr:hypothetical protein [Thermoanaerobaculia bacterium]